MTAEPDSAALVKVTPNQLRLKVGGVVVSTSLIEGHFPKYEDVIPTDANRRVELNTVDFHSALKRAALLTNEESKGVRLSFGDGSLTLSSRAPEQGEAEITIPIEYTGETVDIGFNPVFLMDIVRVAHEDVMRFDFSEPNRPGVMRVGDDFVYVVMPVNLSSA
jgi:DNA polymerase-3 subunit beta